MEDSLFIPVLPKRRIQRVCLYKNMDPLTGEVLCFIAAQFSDEERYFQRRITREQLRGVFFVEDTKAYKFDLAAEVFADKLEE